LDSRCEDDCTIDDLRTKLSTPAGTTTRSYLKILVVGYQKEFALLARLIRFQVVILNISLLFDCWLASPTNSEVLFAMVGRGTEFIETSLTSLILLISVPRNKWEVLPSDCKLEMGGSGDNG
jgi:hypothetical protein